MFERKQNERRKQKIVSIYTTLLSLVMLYITVSPYPPPPLLETPREYMNRPGLSCAKLRLQLACLLKLS